MRVPVPPPLPRRAQAHAARAEAGVGDTAAMAAAAVSGLPPAARVKACTTLEHVVDWAEELGMNGPLGGELPDAERWLGPPSDTERQMYDSLLREADWDALSANAPSWLGKMKTALHWLALVRTALPTMVIFKPLIGPERELNAIHMQEVWAVFGRFMLKHGSLRDGSSGDPSRADNVAAVIGTLRAYRQLGARHCLLDGRFNVFMRRVQKRWRGEDGPRLERKLMLGIRAYHFARLDEVGWDRTSQVGVYEHALASTCKSVVGRPGEPGMVDGKREADWDPTRGVTVADAREWFAATPDVNAGLPWMRIRWFPIKDGTQTHEKVPTPISKRTSAPRGTDPACPYDALLAWWEVRSAAVPETEWATAPLFCHPVTGKIPRTRDLSSLAKKMGRALGLHESSVGGKSWRIAGATDLYDTYQEHAQRLLKERGRWKSDIAYIYARVSEAAHLEASRRMAGATGRDLESSSGWTQPARR